MERLWRCHDNNGARLMVTRETESSSQIQFGHVQGQGAFISPNPLTYMTQSRDYARMTMTITLTHPVSISVLDDLLSLVKRLFTKAYLVWYH